MGRYTNTKLNIFGDFGQQHICKICEEPMETETKEDIKEDKTTPEPEKKFEMLQNPCRALNQQLKVISFAPDQCRYTPLKPLSTGGIIVLRDAKPDDPEDLLEAVAAGGPKAETEEAEPEPP